MISHIKKEINEKGIKVAVPYYVYGLLISFVLLVSDSYYKVESWSNVFGGGRTIMISLLKTLCFAVPIAALLLFLHYAELKRQDLSVPKKKILLYMALMLMCWIPYIIIFFPGAMNPDITDQLAQVIGRRDIGWTVGTIEQIDPDVIINNHHPVFHTMIIGAFLKLGELIGSVAWGFGILGILQCALLAFTLAYSLYFFESQAKNKIIKTILLVTFMLNPILPAWGMTYMKDTLFATVGVWVCILLYKLYSEKKEIPWKKLALPAFVVFVWLLLRNNSFYVMLFMLPITFFVMTDNKVNMKRIMIMLIVVLFIFRVGVHGVLFKSLGISEGSRKEMLAVPLMQIARVIRDDPTSLSKENKEYLVELFGAEDDNFSEVVEAYNYAPHYSDWVKYEVIDDVLREDEGRFLKTYFSIGISKPRTYMQAFINMVYPWFYDKSRAHHRYYDGVTDETITELYPDLNNPEWTRPYREKIANVVEKTYNTVVLRWWIEMSFYTWLTLYSLIRTIKMKKWNRVGALCPLVLNYGICLLGPVAYMRYAVFGVFMLPVLVLIAFLEPRDRTDAACS